MEEFTGIVAGIVYRKDDEVSRWIVTPAAAVFPHESIISLIGFEEQYYDCDEDKRHLLLLKAMVLNEEQEKKYGNLMYHIKNTKNMVYEPKVYYQDCMALQERSCSKFSYGNSSFNAEITVPEGSDRLLFFSVPYEKGWSATVNGAPAEIEVVDIGFMAVRVKGGMTNKIEFRYKTPGLFEGAVITGVSIFAYVLYIVICAKKKILGPKLKLKKSYKVAAVGSADELGEKYKNLTLGRRPMRKRVSVSTAEEPTDNTENTESETQDTVQTTEKTEGETQAESFDN